MHMLGALVEGALLLSSNHTDCAVTQQDCVNLCSLQQTLQLVKVTVAHVATSFRPYQHILKLYPLADNDCAWYVAAKHSLGQHSPRLLPLGSAMTPA